VYGKSSGDYQCMGLHSERKQELENAACIQLTTIGRCRLVLMRCSLSGLEHELPWQGGADWGALFARAHPKFTNVTRN
jgi:hypothetical protein